MQMTTNLIKIIESWAQENDQINHQKTELIKNKNFVPQYVFQYLTEKKAYLEIAVIQQFCQRNKIQSTEQQESVKYIFHNLDSNQDGQISYSDFQFYFIGSTLNLPEEVKNTCLNRCIPKSEDIQLQDQFQQIISQICRIFTIHTMQFECRKQITEQLKKEPPGYITQLFDAIKEKSHSETVSLISIIEFLQNQLEKQEQTSLSKSQINSIIMSKSKNFKASDFNPLNLVPESVGLIFEYEMPSNFQLHQDPSIQFSQNIKNEKAHHINAADCNSLIQGLFSTYMQLIDKIKCQEIYIFNASYLEFDTEPIPNTIKGFNKKQVALSLKLAASYFQNFLNNQLQVMRLQIYQINEEGSASQGQNKTLQVVDLLYCLNFDGNHEESQEPLPQNQLIQIVQEIRSQQVSQILEIQAKEKTCLPLNFKHRFIKSFKDINYLFFYELQNKSDNFLQERGGDFLYKIQQKAIHNLVVILQQKQTWKILWMKLQRIFVRVMQEYKRQLQKESINMISHCIGVPIQLENSETSPYSAEMGSFNINIFKRYLGNSNYYLQLGNYENVDKSLINQLFDTAQHVFNAFDHIVQEYISESAVHEAHLGNGISLLMNFDKRGDLIYQSHIIPLKIKSMYGIKLDEKLVKAGKGNYQNIFTNYLIKLIRYMQSQRPKKQEFPDIVIKKKASKNGFYVIFRCLELKFDLSLRERFQKRVNFLKRITRQLNIFKTNAFKDKSLIMCTPDFCQIGQIQECLQHTTCFLLQSKGSETGVKQQVRTMKQLTGVFTTYINKSEPDQQTEFIVQNLLEYYDENDQTMCGINEQAILNFDSDNQINIKDPNLDCLKFNSIAKLHGIAWKIFNEKGLINEFQINTNVWCNFAHTLSKKYNFRKNYFHNYYHAVTTLHGVFFLSEQARIKNILPTPMCHFALLLSAICHDVDHPAFTNQFLMNSQSELSIRYNDISVLENHHASVAFQIMQEKNCNILENLNQEQYNCLRLQMVQNILATDMSHHFTLLDKFEKLLALANAEKREFGKDEIEILKVRKMVMHGCDFFGTVKPFQISSQWSLLVNKEFSIQYEREVELDIKVTPYFKGLSDFKVRAKNEVGFLKMIVKPIWNQLNILLENKLSETVKQIEESIELHQKNM